MILNHWSAVVFQRLLFLALLSVASMQIFAERGVVAERATGKPIPGAVVVATWSGVVRTVAEPASQCYKAEVIVANDAGEFEVSSLSWNLNPFMLDRRRELSVIAPGYKESPTWPPTQLQVLMEPQVGSKAEQFKNLPEASATMCFGDKRILLPYLRALHSEMMSLATKKEELLKASGILFLIEKTELGEAKALVNSGQRRGDIEQRTK